MDIYISGDLTTFAPTIAEALLADGHHVVVSSKHEAIEATQHKNFLSYEMSVDDDLYPEIFASHSFDAIIHILNQPNIYDSHRDSRQNLVNSALLETSLQFGSQTGVKKFILISSLEIYGNSTEIKETQAPVPATAFGQIAANAENLCKFHAAEDMQVAVIRIPAVYGDRENYSPLAELITQSKKQKNVTVPFGKLTHCNFLHVDDLSALLLSILEHEEMTDFQVFNLGTEDINYHYLSQQLNIYFPHVTYSFPDGDEPNDTGKKITVENAKNFLDWKPKHHVISDLASLTAFRRDKLKTKGRLAKRIGKITGRLRPFLVWVEVTLGALLMHMLTVWTNTIIEFKVIDYRLIFVVLIGSIHGLLFGIIAAILAAASALLAWNSVGLDLALLIYNVENWIPFTVYFLAGSVTGYLHDKQTNDLLFEKNQTTLIHEKYSFLFSLYNEISTIKNRLREQLVGYRDSFGRFFRIANELNELDEDNIFFKALEILEELMKNDQIAIYSIESSGNFGRLQVSSKTIRQEIPKSMRLDDYQQALDFLKSGDVFQNKDLIANYPAYIAPIMNNSNLIGLVIIWEAKFDQFNMYYFNLFKVITGLIESSLVRAATFENAQFEKLYLPATRILRPEPFKQTLSIRKKMRRNKVSAFQILRIPRGNDSWEDVYKKISKGIRSEDVVGIMDEQADVCFAILANAGVENIGMIRNRMQNNGIASEHILDLEDV